MPIDLVIDERDGTKPDLGDTNNNSGAARASTADTSHTDGSSTPDVVSRRLFSLFLFFFFFFFFLCLISSSFVVVVVVVVVDHPHLHGGVVRVASGSKDIAAAPAVGVLQALLSPRGFLSLFLSLSLLGGEAVSFGSSFALAHSSGAFFQLGSFKDSFKDSIQDSFRGSFRYSSWDSIEDTSRGFF